jgi:hypothetical protein
MARKRVDPLKAKQAKQKKIAIVGAILLVGIVAFQGPKTLKMLKGPQPVTPPAAAPATPTPGAAPAPAAGGPATPATPATPVAATELASVPDSDAAPEAEQGQLATFERFASKDPFAQQAQPQPEPRVSKPKDGKDEPKPKPVEKPAAKPGGFTTGGSTAPDPPVLATATSIAVNGIAEDVTPDTPFPAAEPTFVLVSVARDGKSVELGIAGGSYAGGGQTMKLKLGQKLTLQNTADGSRYELELLSIQGFPLPKKK